MASDIEERIRARAHAIWEEEGRPEGRAEEHWARATREVETAMAAEGGAPAEMTDAPAERKPSTRKPAVKKAEPSPDADATPARKPAASRKSATAEKAPKAEPAPEPTPRKPRARKAQSA